MKKLSSRTCKLAGALALALTVTAGVARADYPPASVLAGQWWNWVLEIPAAINPLSDTNGQFSAVGQSGPVYFLAGNFGGTSVRTFTVPAGKPLFFPIANYFACGYLHSPKAGGFPPNPIAYQRQLCSEGLVGLTAMACEVDGISVPITEANHVFSAPFALRLPADNLFQAAPMTCAPGVDEGYYVLLMPLAPGPHTIHFTASNPLTSWTLDVTDYITVQ